MAELLKTTESGIIGGREYWVLDNNLTLLITINNDPCTIYISNKDNDFIKTLSKYLKYKKLEHNLTATIDSYFVELGLNKKDIAIELIENWSW